MECRPSQPEPDRQREAWIVTDGVANTGVLGLFTQEALAHAYRADLARRAALGGRAAIPGHERISLAAASQQPKVISVPADLSPDDLPGAWVVQIDERTGHMRSCTFDLRKKPSRPASHEHTSYDGYITAYGISPQDAFYRARLTLDAWRRRISDRAWDEHGDAP